jgi:hypothetical protein
MIKDSGDRALQRCGAIIMIVDAGSAGEKEHNLKNGVRCVYGIGLGFRMSLKIV